MTVMCCENTSVLNQSNQTNLSSKTTRLARVWAMLKRLATVMRNRHSVEKLNYATDHELADMGLRREDLYVINHAPMFEDPSVELQRRASENTRCLKKRLS